MIEDYLPHVPKIKLPDVISGILPTTPGEQIQSNSHTIDAIMAAQRAAQNKKKDQPKNKTK